MRFYQVLCMGLLVQGCATITSGTSQTITVLSDPPGATCELKRGDALIGMVNPTPGSITVSKATSDIVLRCTRPDHFPGSAEARASFQAATLGNILLGGVVGLAIDAASGAMGTYPGDVTVILAPARFAADADRDAYFAARSLAVRSGFDERIAAIRRDCPRENPVPCDARVATLEQQLDAALRELEEQRLAVQIRT